MDKSHPNLLDPEFEPTDEQLTQLTEAALRRVLARAAASRRGALVAAGLPPGFEDEPATRYTAAADTGEALDAKSDG